jgi:hypothetical protein
MSQSPFGQGYIFVLSRYSSSFRDSEIALRDFTPTGMAPG